MGRVSAEARRRYRQSVKGRAASARWDQSLVGLAKHREYDRSPARKAAKARYRQSAKGRAAELRYRVSKGLTAPKRPEPQPMTELDRLIVEQARDDRTFQIRRPRNSRMLFVDHRAANRLFYGGAEKFDFD